MAPEDEDLDLSDVEAAAAERPPVDGPDHDPEAEPQDADDGELIADAVAKADPGPQAEVNPIAGVGSSAWADHLAGKGTQQDVETT